MDDCRSPCHTVLVVEDEPLARLDAVETLRDAGFAVVEASDAAEALDLIARRTDIALVFTDINMPGALDGLALAERVRCSYPSMHLIVTSGAVQPAPGVLPRDSDFIAKPYSPAAVAAVVSGKLHAA